MFFVILVKTLLIIRLNCSAQWTPQVTPSIAEGLAAHTEDRTPSFPHQAPGARIRQLDLLMEKIFPAIYSPFFVSFKFGIKGAGNGHIASLAEVAKCHLLATMVWTTIILTHSGISSAKITISYYMFLCSLYAVVSF